MKKRIFLCYLFFITASTVIFAQTLVYTDILEYRLKNDSDFSIIANNAEIAKNNYKRIRISSLFAVELSTGQINLTINKDKKKSSFSMEPSLLLGTPLYNNLSLTLKTPYTSANGGNDFRKGISLALSADIYSQTRNKLKLQLDEAYETMNLAEKKLNMGKQLIEKKLLTNIQKILVEYTGVLAKKLGTVRANIDYKQVLAQGYGENSAKLRTAKLSLLSAEREQKEAEFSFSISSKIFFESCGIHYDEKETEEFFKNLSLSIPNVQIASTENLSEENYSVIVKAEQDYKNALIQNKINLDTVTISGELNFSAFKIQNEFIDPNTSLLSLNKNKETSVGGGIHMLLPGIKLYSGVSIPIADKTGSSYAKKDLSPSLHFMLAVNPISIYDYTLKKKNAKLFEINEKIKLNEIKRNFENEFKQFTIQKEKFEWQQQVSLEEIDIYRKNAEEHAQWFARGVISSFENMQADIEYKRALVRYADANINVHIFNTQIKELFETGGK